MAVKANKLTDAQLSSDIVYGL